MKLMESQGATLHQRRRRRLARADGEESAEDECLAGSLSEGEVVAAPYLSERAVVSRSAKRAMDVAVAATAGVLLSPAMVLVAIAIRCISSGPILYGQVRHGRNGRPFLMWKFRTMVVDAEEQLQRYLDEHPDIREEWNAGFKLKNDPRVIPWIGRLLRASSVDELPQLWNVVRGEMSLVGPRPLPRYHLDQFDESFIRVRESMPPGVTGLWQLKSRRGGSPEMFRQWDSEYVRTWSIWLDLWVIARTPWVLLTVPSARVRDETETTLTSSS